MTELAAAQTRQKPHTMPAARGVLQRKCACGQHTGTGGECAECKRKRLGLQRQAISAYGPATAPPIVHEVLRVSGQPLDTATRAFMEPRFGHDFSRVRVHTDAQAAESARAVNALAYTVGRDVVFGAGQYAPGTNIGTRLLAHELTHVAQQNNQADPNLNKLILEEPGTSSERAADAVTEIVMQGRHVEQTLASKTMPSIQRQPVGFGDVKVAEERLAEWGGFNIYGDSNFIASVQADFDSINATANGRAVLQKIKENRSGWFKPDIPIEFLNSCGFIGGDIYYNPSSCVGSNRCQGSSSGWESVPNYVYLFHEVVHAYLHYIEGKGSDRDRECMATGLGDYFTSIPYNENRLRCELGLPIRPCYNGQCTKFPAPNCLPAVIPQPAEDERE